MSVAEPAAVPVTITLYRWAGAWGPFKVSIPCGECSLTLDVINDTLAHELEGIPVRSTFANGSANGGAPFPKEVGTPLSSSWRDGSSVRDTPSTAAF